MPIDESPEDFLVRHLPMLREVVDTLARRRRLTKEEAEDLLSEVQIKLLDNDGAALLSCRDPKRLRGFFATTASRALMDRRNHELGRWRPCAEATRRGPDAEFLNQLLIRDAKSVDEAVEILRMHGIEWSREEIEEMAALFPPWQSRRQEDEETLVGHAAPGDSPEGAAIAAERAEQRDRALRLIDEEMATWPFEDAFIVRDHMHGVAVAEIARRLNIPQRPLYRRFEKLFRRLREALGQEGIGREELAEILRADSWSSLESSWEDEESEPSDRENSTTGPSHQVEGPDDESDDES